MGGKSAVYQSLQRVSIYLFFFCFKIPSAFIHNSQGAIQLAFVIGEGLWFLEKGSAWCTIRL